MGEADETETPDDSDTTEGEPKEEEVTEESEDNSEGNSEETTDPEDPELPDEEQDNQETPEVPEVPEETPDEEPVEENQVNDAQINAKGDTYATITIAGYKELKEMVTFTVTGTEAKISAEGTITATEGDNGAKPAITLGITAKDGYQITSVKNGETDVAVSDKTTCTVSGLTADATITVTAVAVYSLTLANDGDTTYGIKVKTGTNEDGSDKTEAVANDGSAKFERGKLEFTVDGYTAAADGSDRLKVYYVTDGSDDDDTTEITGTTSGEGAAAKTTYSVDEGIINSLDGSIKIILKKETKGTVGFADNDKVKVQYWGKKNATAAETDLENAWVVEEGTDKNDTKYDKITTAFVGDTFKFKVMGVDPYVVSKVTVGGEEITLQTNGEYSVTVTEEMFDADAPAKIAFETVYDSAKSRTLTYTLTGDEDSATAKITSVTPAATEETPNPPAATVEADMAAALGIAVADLTLESEKALTVLAAPTAIEVTITPAVAYELVLASGETAEADGSLKKTYTGTSLTSAIAIAATTQEKALAGTDSKFFKAAIKETSTNLSGLALVTNDKVTPVTGKTDTFEVKPGARNVAFTVTAKEGFKPADIAGAKVTAGAPAANGDVVYTVALPVATITGADAENPNPAIEVEEAAINLSASVKAAEGSNAAEYTAEMETKAKDAEADDPYTPYVSGDIAFGSAFRAIITPSAGCRLDEVSYVMGTADAVTVPVTLDDDDDPQAVVEIPKMTGVVEITVKSGKDYKITDLMEVGEVSNTTLTPDSDGIYDVKYGGKYLVGVTQGGVPVAAKNISVTVKDETGAAVAMTNPIVNTNYRQINLGTKKLAGQEITAEIFVKGVEGAVGTYIMDVEKKTTAITLNGGAAIAQSVDSVNTYDFTTDGDPENLTVAVTGDIRSFISTSFVNGKLKITAAPAKRADVATSKTEGETTTWTPKTAKVTLKATDVEDLEASVDITLNPLFNEDAAPEVSLVDAADNALNVKVSMGEVAKPYAGSVWYKVTATAKDPETPAAGEAAKQRPAELAASVTEIVKVTGSSDRVALKVADTNLGELGEGKDWGYNVTAQLFYMANKVKPEKTATAADAKAVSKEGKLEDAATKVPLFEDALKLKKAKGAPAKLYTGQTGDIVIAEPQWTKKFNSYKIVEDQIYDSFNYGSDYESEKLTLGVNADGNIIVKGGVPETAALGKHTITVVATADQTTGHTMYASRATITVNVVKGINELLVTQPSESIFKDKNKTGTLKLGVDYNHDYAGQSDSYSSVGSWNGKKWICAPASKKVTWSIVDASSTEYDIVAAPAYLKVDTTGKGKTAPDGVGVKNGTVTVGKNFVIDGRHKNNNQFKVLVEAADFDGNTTKALSETITITADAHDISTLVVVKDGVVTAVNDIKNKKPVEVLAGDVDDGYVYALPADAGVTKGTAWNSRIAKMAVPASDITITPTSKKVMDVEDGNKLNVLAAGKKAGVKVVTNDGGKKTHTMTLTLGFKETAGNDLALGIGYYKRDDTFYAESTSLFAPTGTNVAKANKANVKETPVEVKLDNKFTGTPRLDIGLYVGDKTGGTSTRYDRTDDVRFTNYKLAVKGGKVISNGNGRATVVMTAGETVLTLTDLTKEAKTAKKTPYVYKIVNEAYDKTKVTGKAPKVTVKGSLYAFGTAKEQNEALKLTVLDADNKNVPFNENKTVKVELDWSARTDKNWYMLNDFAGSLNLSAAGANTAKLGKTGTISLFGGCDNDDWINPYTGSYKLKVTVGSGEGANFKAETLPATVNVKVAKAKKFTFKPTTSYTINKADGGAVLTGKSNANAKAGELTYMYFDDLQNVNIKGKSNKFTHYFAIKSDPLTGTQRLTLNTEDPLVRAMIYEPQKNTDGTDKTDADGNVLLSTTLKEDPVITIPKEDLTGYIHYSAYPSVEYYENGYASGTVKITVKIAPEIKAGKTAKASQKYATNKAEVALTANSKTEMNVIVNGAYVSVAYALEDETKAKSNAEELDVELAGNAKGQIVVKAVKALEEGKSYSTNLLIVPNSSFYKTAIDLATAATAAKEGEEAAKATKQDLIKKYGIAVKVSVLASSKPNPTPDPTDDGSGEEPGVTDEIATVAVTATADSVAKGATLTFTATAADSNGAAVDGATWAWAVTGAGDEAVTAGTTIAPVAGTNTATLTVASGETLENLKVTATATKGTSSKSASKTVSVTDGATTEKTVTSVTVSASPDTYTVGGSAAVEVTFTATVNGTGLEAADKTVTWQIVGTEGSDYVSGTSIDANGKLTIATNETAESITVKATSTVDTSVSGTKEITKQS